MTPERQKILAGEILDLSDKINHNVKINVEIDLEDYYNLQMMADVLARQVVAFKSQEEKKEFVDDWWARKTPDPRCSCPHGHSVPGDGTQAEIG